VEGYGAAPVKQIDSLH